MVKLPLYIYSLQLRKKCHVEKKHLFIQFFIMVRKQYYIVPYIYGGT